MDLMLFFVVYFLEDTTNTFYINEKPANIHFHSLRPYIATVALWQILCQSRGAIID
jgi:hypothetical protein